MSAYINIESIHINPGAIRVADHPELGVTTVHLSEGGATLQGSDSRTFRALAIACAEAAQMREAAEQAEQAARDPVQPGPTVPDAEDHTGHSASGSSDPGNDAP